MQVKNLMPARKRILLLLVCLTLAGSASLPAKESRKQGGVESFIQSIAATTYAAAWPTATYKKASIKRSTRVGDGYDVAVRLLGESTFGGELWLDLVFEIRGGSLSDMRVGNHNAILMAPFETAKTFGAFLEEMLKEYGNSTSTQYSAPVRAAPTHSAKMAGAVCLKNPTSHTLNYAFRWGEGEWTEQAVEAGSNRWHWWPYAGSEHVSPKFSIRFDNHFDTGYTETSYWLPRGATSLPITCDRAKRYEFFVSGRKIDLKSLNN